MEARDTVLHDIPLRFPSHSPEYIRLQAHLGILGRYCHVLSLVNIHNF